jgi:acyl-CoA thioester hydrolase
MSRRDGLEIRVIYGDTDQMGVVYYANYLRYFEAARGSFVRAHGISYADLEKQGLAWPVIEAHVRYHRPARYDDLIFVELFLEAVRGASFRFGYKVRRGEDLIAEGSTEHACIGPDGRAVRLPADLRALMESVVR